MKKFLSVVLVLIAIGQVNANDIAPNAPLGISVVKKGVLVKLFYRGEESGKVKVTIYNEKGLVVFSEIMQDTEHFMRPYNFSSLPHGEYTIELSDKSGKQYQKISHKGETKRIAHLTRLNKRENKYMLTVPNTGNDVITIRIYDHASKVLFEETQNIQGNFAKVYNLNAVSSSPTFEVVDRNGKVNRLSTY